MKYQKRIHWDRYRPEFFKIGLIFALAITFMAFNYTSEPKAIEPYFIEPIEDVMITPPITVHEKKTVLPPPPPPRIKTIVKIEPVAEPVVNFQPKVELKKDVEVVVDEYATPIIHEPAPKVEIVKEEVPVEEGPLIMAERMPVYGDCDLDSDEGTRRECTHINLKNHTYSNINYPKLAVAYELEGTVVVSFVVNKLGEVEDIEIIRDIGMGCGDEVKRAISELGKFLPGKQNGRPVSVIYRLPVKFKLK